ncbi:PIN domain-like protein [Rickenella mellea]|uniref:PIN domain-like protein n=1 Tax=Rickenella mellea TaxID=50990 RepID=A0A4Y7PPV5_9AGAM|nr:PIN domain-like protein [Rickenella mellea]
MDSSLWNTVSSSSRSRFIEELAITVGYRKGQLYTIGIDISAWIFDIQAMLVSTATRGGNPELRIIFYRLARLSAIPVRPIFVFHGEELQANQKGRRFEAHDHYLVRTTKALLQTFGFPIHVAPVSAAAELARMNKDGIVHAIISDDFDVLVYGARTVLRMQTVLQTSARPFWKPTVAVLTADSMHDDPRVRLSTGGLLLTAVLCSGNRDSAVGIHGRRPAYSISHALARTHFGDSLLASAKKVGQDRAQSLNEWRSALKTELRENTSGSLPMQLPNFADRIQDEFPDPSLLDSYIYPDTSWTSGSGTAPNVATRSPLDVAALAKFCNEHFLFGSADDIVEKFCSVLWRGIGMDLLLRRTDPNPSPLLHHEIELFDILKIVRTRLHGSAEYLEYLVEADASGLQDVVQSALSDLEGSPPRSASPFSLAVSSTIRTWLPGPLFQAAFPALVKPFHSDNGTSMLPSASNVIDLTESDDELDLSDVELEITGCHSDSDSIIDLVSDSD